ncbi:hypothetical protein, partial [Corallococcus praedator]|uniref:hypothetical protein n=1 Tax=Corallococcus praedator TaxID=2316724 RepID=UPI0011C40AD1
MSFMLKVSPPFSLTSTLSCVTSVIYALAQPMQFLGKVSVYGSLVPYRARFGFVEGDQPGVSALNLDEMFAAHEINAPPDPRDFRVGIFGASPTWGYGVQWDQTMAACLNGRATTMPDGRRIRAFNLGYPLPSSLRDLLLMQRAL